LWIIRFAIIITCTSPLVDERETARNAGQPAVSPHVMRHINLSTRIVTPQTHYCLGALISERLPEVSLSNIKNYDAND
jgi:hypothetical protein